MRVLFITCALLLGCKEPESSVRKTQLFFTSGYRGQLVPEGEQGGLPRLVSVLQRANGPRWLDVGDLFPAGADPEQARLLAHCVGRHALALNLGPTELGQAGLLRGLRREGALPWLSANARPLHDWSLARSFVRSVDGVRIGITGVVLPESIEAKDFVLLEHGPALANEVHALEDQGAEVFVLLARMEQEEARTLAQVAPRLDFIIYGADRAKAAPPAPVREGRTWLLHGGRGGHAVGRLELEVRASETPFASSEAEDGATEVSGPNLFSLELVPLDDSVLPDPNVAARVQSWVEESGR